MISAIPNAADRARYEAWQNALGEVSVCARRLERQRHTVWEGLAPDALRRKTARLDSLKPPLPYRSWEHLGEAIHGRAYRPKDW